MWKTIPSLKSSHIQGTLDTIGEQFIVIGGRDSNIVNNGIVEIFDPVLYQWSFGPSLEPSRRSHTTVVVNATSLVVIGGFGDPPINMMNTVEMFTIAESWHPLNDFPIRVYLPVCGLVNESSILCIGGREPTEVSKSSYGLDLSSGTWTRLPLFETDVPIMAGFVFQLRNELFCMSIWTTQLEHLRQLMWINLTQEIPSWEVLEVFPNEMFLNVGSFVLNGHVLFP